MAGQEKSTEIELGDLEEGKCAKPQLLPRTAPQDPYQQPPPYGFHSNAPNTPMYQQRLDGQNVYYVDGPPPPQNVSRGGGRMFQMNIPNQPDDPYYYRNAGIFTDTFDSVRIRNRFVQRVYTILFFQLLFSFGIILLVVFQIDVRIFFVTHWLAIFITSMITYLVTAIALICASSLRRTFPINFILLCILTIALTLMLCIVTATVHTNAALYAIGTTALVCLLVSLVACQTKWDVTGCGMCLCMGMVVLLIFGLIIMIMQLFGVYFKILHIIYSSIATLLFCFWLMFDTQQIMGGRRIELSPEEYIYGALSLYIDIMYIFMNIMMLYELCLGGR